MKIGVLFFLLMSGCLSAEKYADLTPDKITTVRMHASIHAAPAARGQALLQIVGLEGGCTGGVFLDAKVDKELYSIVLTAFASKSAVKIGYEPNIKSPWGDLRYCALTYFDIK